jgi:hypothetical protein
MKAALLALVLALSGCATCQQHPTACAIAGAVIAGSIAATVVANDHHHHGAAGPRRVACDPGVTACGSAP